MVTVEAHGDVALARMDRPPANALDPELLAQGTAVIDELRRSEAGAVVLVGREGFFSAGADLKLVPELDEAGQRAMVDAINGVFAAWYGFPRPVVCAVNGHAIAGGLILALCGDYRVGATEGRFGLTELRVGVPYPAAAMAVVRAELSPPAARCLTLRADLIGPERALELGLFDELAAPADVLPRALEVANELAALPSRAYGVVKLQLRGETIAEMRRVLEPGGEPLLGAWLHEETQAASSRALDGS